MFDDLITEVNKLPNPQHNLLARNERVLIELCYSLRGAIEAQKKHIAGLDQSLVICNSALDNSKTRITELEAAGNEIVKWWLSDGHKLMTGAPYAMFRLRTALGHARAAVGENGGWKSFYTI